MGRADYPGFPVGEQSRLDLTYRLSEDKLFDYDLDETTGLPGANSSPIIRTGSTLRGLSRL